MGDGSKHDVVLRAEEARDLCRRILEAAGTGQADAETVSQCLLKADLRGVDTHGLSRLPGYLARISRGLLDPAAEMILDPVTPVAARLDAANGFGFVAASRAMDAALERAAAFGIGVVGVSNSTHFGMAASYLLQAIERGFAALVFTNASPALPPWGGRSELFGTSPLGAAFPGDPPFVLDMAPTIVARGKIRRAAQRGAPIPEGWALDKDGRPTTDASAAMDGVLLPIGGPKGAGLSMMMDLFGGLFTGANFAGTVGNQYKDFDRPQGVGHLVLALKPDLFQPMDEIKTRMAHLAATVKESPRAAGVDDILLPGEPEARIEARRLREGIPYHAQDLAAVVNIARRSNIPLPAALQHVGHTT